MSNDRTTLLYYAIQNQVVLRFFQNGQVELDGLIYPSASHARNFVHRMQRGGDRTAEELLPPIDPPASFDIALDPHKGSVNLPEGRGIALLIWPDPSCSAEAFVWAASGSAYVQVIGLPKSFANMVDNGQYTATYQNGKVRVDF